MIISSSSCYQSGQYCVTVAQLAAIQTCASFISVFDPLNLLLAALCAMQALSFKLDSSSRKLVQVVRCSQNLRI